MVCLDLSHTAEHTCLAIMYVSKSMQQIAPVSCCHGRVSSSVKGQMESHVHRSGATMVIDDVCIAYSVNPGSKALAACLYAPVLVGQLAIHLCRSSWVPLIGIYAAVLITANVLHSLLMVFIICSACAGQWP